MLPFFMLLEDQVRGHNFGQRGWDAIDLVGTVLSIKNATFASAGLKSNVGPARQSCARTGQAMSTGADSAKVISVISSSEFPADAQCRRLSRTHIAYHEAARIFNAYDGNKPANKGFCPGYTLEDQLHERGGRARKFTIASSVPRPGHAYGLKLLADPKCQGFLVQRCGAPGPTRTGTQLPEPDFESGASTSSATGASPAANKMTGAERRIIERRDLSSIRDEVRAYENAHAASSSLTASATMSRMIWLSWKSFGV